MNLGNGAQDAHIGVPRTPISPPFSLYLINPVFLLNSENREFVFDVIVTFTILINEPK